MSVPPIDPAKAAALVDELRRSGIEDAAVLAARMQKAGWGWAMWNFRGSMGVIDSDRRDVQYEDFEGHKLDRKLMDLLQRY